MSVLSAKPCGLGIYSGYVTGDPRRINVWQAGKKSWSATIGTVHYMIGKFESKDAAERACVEWIREHPHKS